MSSQNRERGFVLLLTLWILAILSALLISFTMAVSANIKAASYQRDDIAATLLARSALARVSSALAQPESLGVDAELAWVRGEHLGLWYVDPVDWGLSREPLEEPDQQVRIECRVSAEDSKLPVAKLNAAMLGKMPGMSPVLAEQIAAFLVQRGAENPLKIVEELLMVDEVAGKVYDEAENEKNLIDFITAFSDGQVYVNAAAPQALSALPGVDPDLAGEFAERIEQERFLERVEDLRGVPGVTPSIYKILKPWISVSPVYHRLQVTARVRGIARTVQGVYRIAQGKVTPIFTSGG